MSHLYPVVIALTLLSGCASSVHNARHRYDEGHVVIATTVGGAPRTARENKSGTPRRAPGKGTAGAHKKAREPRRDPWVPERLGY